MDFRDYQPQIAPAFIQDTNGIAFTRAEGDVKDALADRCQHAVKARFPNLAPDDALDTLGVERGLPRIPGEARSEYSERLRDAWNSWALGGTPLGLLQALAEAGYTTRLVIPGGLDYSLASGALVVTPLAAGSWLIDSDPPLWSRFQVLFTDSSEFSDPLPASGSSTVEALRAIVRRWQPAHATCAGLIVPTAGRLWGYPYGRTWGTQGGTWSGNTATTWEV
jgi:hypothetical protein